MPRKSERLANKLKANAKRDDILPDDICHKCNDWCNPITSKNNDNLGYACDECHHSYHDRCIPPRFRNKGFRNCSDVYFECDHESPPIQFKLPMKAKDHTVHTNNIILEKTRSQRQSKRIKKKRPSVVAGIHRKTYGSFTYCNIKYTKGDDVAIYDNICKAIWIARVTDIYSDDNELIPTMGVIWFWKTSDIDIVNDTDSTDVDISSHEVYIDDTYPDVMGVDMLVSKTSSSKVLVVSSGDEYLREKQKKTNDDLYYDIYWCKYSYHKGTKKRVLLPPGTILGHKTTGITPMNIKKTRKRDRRATIENALNDASKALMLSTVPDVLLCREEEHEEISNYMRQQIMSYGQGSGLYISGMPGTGKTATVRQIANELKKCTGNRRRKTDRIPDFEFCEINAMKLPTPKHIYTELAKKVLDKHFAPNTAVRKLEKHFLTKDNQRKICVLLVDELDFLLTRQQKVIYNIFDWPTKKHAKLVVIGIANTMDLPERLLPRVSSRLGTKRVVFKSYQRDQLTDIIEQRLESTKVFSADAIRFCASAVAGVSGDCRTALQICRRAVEIAQRDIEQNGISHLVKCNNHNKRPKTRKKKKKGKNDYDDTYGEDIVTLQHLKSAKDAFDQTNDIQIVSMCSIYEKLFLTAIVMCNTRSDGFAGMTSKYRTKFDNFVQTKLGHNKMSNVHFRNMVDRLADIGIITVAFEKNEWQEFITFNVKIDEARHALKENDICAKILSTLQTT